MYLSSSSQVFSETFNFCPFMYDLDYPAAIFVLFVETEMKQSG